MFVISVKLHKQVNIYEMKEIFFLKCNMSLLRLFVIVKHINYLPVVLTFELSLSRALNV